MIADRTIGPMHAENRRRTARRGILRIVMALLAAVLILPSQAAWGREIQNSNGKPTRFETIALPPVPSLGLVPWLDWKRGMKVDTLLSPILDPSGIKLEPDERDREKPAVS